MSDLNDAVFWLPDELLLDNDAVSKTKSVTFPTEFPYEFDSAETESDEEDFLAGLTRRLTHSSQKLAVPASVNKPQKWVLSGSPESTLSGIGTWSVSSNSSPNGSSSLVSSPPATPFNSENDTWDLISAAAGEIARLKMSNQTVVPKQSTTASSVSPKSLVSNQNTERFVKNQNFNGFNHQFHQLPSYMKQEQSMRAGQQNQQVKPQPWVSQLPQQHPVQIQNKRPCNGLPFTQSHSVWPQPVQIQSNVNPSMRAVFLNGSGSTAVKRECAGTGVFLPRRYNNSNSTTITDSRKKQSCPTVLLPAKVVQALNLNFEDMNYPQFHPHHPQQCFNGAGFCPNYDSLMARRNTLLTLQKRSLRPDPALHLPQDWTY